MKHLFVTIAAFLSISVSLHAQMYKSKTDATTISFYSKSPLEDIDATSKKGTVVFKPESGDLQAAVGMTSFKFPKPLMEEHFNENYVESTKFPTCIFKGKVVEKIDYTKDGENKVTVKGTMTLHGVTKDVEMTGTLTKKGNEFTVVSDFKIRVADYDIKVPSLYVKNIAEVVDVKVSSTLEPFVKK